MKNNLIDNNEIISLDNNAPVSIDSKELGHRSFLNTKCPNVNNRVLVDKATILLNFKSKEELFKTKRRLQNQLSEYGFTFPREGHVCSKWPHSELLIVSYKLSRFRCGHIKSNLNNKQLKIQFSGQGCQWLSAIDLAFEKTMLWLKDLGGKLLEVDIACDDISGKYTVRQAQKDYSAKRYNPVRGQAPESFLIKSKTGKSLQIGANQSPKRIVIYEKGKQLELSKNDERYQKWTRHEVRLRWIRGRELDMDILQFPDRYFAGAYSANRKILKGSVPAFIHCELVSTTSKDLIARIKNMRKQYGPSMSELRKTILTDSEIVSCISREGKLNKATSINTNTYLDELINCELKKAVLNGFEGGSKNAN